jgi:hypothetical protein
LKAICRCEKKRRPLNVGVPERYDFLSEFGGCAIIEPLSSYLLRVVKDLDDDELSDVEYQEARQVIDVINPVTP